MINHVQKKHANNVADTKKKVIQGIMLDNYTNDKNKIILVQPQNTGRSSKGGTRDSGHRNRGNRGGNRRDNESKKEWKDLDDLRDANQSRAGNRMLVEYGDI